MSADKFFQSVESLLREFLLTMSIFRVRPANNFVLISFENDGDFSAAVMAATGSNIRLEVFSTLEGRAEKDKGLGSCVLRFELNGGCLDERLIFFLREVLDIKFVEKSISVNDFKLHKNGIDQLEEWLGELRMQN